MKEATEALLDKIDGTALPMVCAVLVLTSLRLGLASGCRPEWRAWALRADMNAVAAGDLDTRVAL
jgi:hypothetical protein